MNRLLKLTTLFIAFLTFSNLNAQIELAGIFSDNMVLQQNQKVKIWKTAKVGEVVNIQVGWNKTTKASTNDVGKWETSIKTPKVGNGIYKITVSCNNESVTLNNLVTGEVWFCSGQSNMRFQLYHSKSIEKDTMLANNSQIRLFNDAENDWQESTFDVAKQFSAVGFYFGLNIYQKLDVPVELILITGKHGTQLI